jgi:PAS domain S-box-containing protein
MGDDEPMTESSVADLTALVRLMPNATFIHDLDGTLLTANDSGQAILDATILPLDETLPWVPSAAPLAQVDLHVLHPDGAEQWVIADSHHVEVGGQQVVLTSLVDVTERHGWARSAIEGVIERFQLSWAGSHLPVFLVHIDDDRFGTIMVANPALAELVGERDEPLEGRHLAELFDLPGAGGRQAADAELRRLLADEDTGPGIDAAVRREDGPDSPVVLGLTVARGPMGRPLFVLGYTIDQTPLAEAEEARRRDLAHTELIYEFGSDVVAVISPDGTFDFVGPSSGDVLGLDRRELIGEVGFDLVHPDDRELARSALDVALAHPGVNEPVHLRIRDGNDTWRPVEIVANNLLDVAEVGGLVITVRDRSQQAQAEADLERSQRQMSALLEALPDLIFRLGADGTYLDFHSPDPARLIVPPEEFIGRRVDQVITDQIAPGVGQEFIEVIAVVLSESRPATLHYELEYADGTHQFEARLTPIQGEEVIAVVRDISDLHRWEQQRLEHERELVRRQSALERAALERELERASRIEAMGYLAATMAHDVNNLLGVINNYASSIRRSQPGWSVQRDAEEISAAVARGAELTQRLLRIGRRPAEMHSIEPMRDLVHELAQSLRGAFDLEGGADLVTDLTDDPSPVRGSRPRIEQAVMNLVLNARDAAEAAGGRVVVTLAVERRVVTEGDWRPETVAPGEYVVVSVVDAGGGIPEQVRPRVFEPFFSTKDGSSSGLGLPIVREVAEQHGGGVGIHSVVVDGVAGTRMELWLPVAMASPTASPEPHRGVRVLLVDDDDDVRRSTRQLLEGLGHVVVDVRSASGAAAAIDGGEAPDLILSDVRMPGTSGPELIRQLRSVAPGLPAIFVTGYADDLSSAPDLADVPVLVKPYSVDDLAALILRHARPADLS